MKILDSYNSHNSGNIKPKNQIRISGTTYKSDILILNNKQKKQPSFCKLTINIEVPNFIINSRIKKLKKLGLSGFYAQKLARLDSARYKKALELISIGVFEESIEDTTKLDEEEYKKALELVKHDITNEDLAFFAKLEEKEYNRIIELKDKGIDTEQLSLFISLKENEYQQAIELIKKGHTPVEAACLASLTEEQKEIALSLKKLKVPIEIASEIARMEPLQRDSNIDLIKRGISAEEVEYITNFDEENKKRINEIISFDLGDENITNFALFSDKDYTKAITLFKNGVLPKYIPSIIAIENGEIINRTYEEYRKRGYSRSISYALSLLDENQVIELSKIIKKNKKIKDLLTQEYDIQILKLQNSEKIEVIFSRYIRCENGTKITLVQIFDKNGNSTKSRLEEYSNNITSSILSGKTTAYKAEYDEYGQIKELSQFIQDPKTQSVLGIIHSKTSKLLPGAFESVYYEISDFYESNSNENNEIEFDIDNSIKAKGKPISTVDLEKDGTIVYRENFKRNGKLTKRTYKERKNDAGELSYSYYSYKIRDDKNKEIMNIQREYIKHNDNSATNIINGIEYHIKYDDENKEITISDGKRSRTISFKDKLAYYSQDILWKTIKTLPVDTLLTIDDNTKKWNFCREEDSTADGYSYTISTGKNVGVILHETGHFKDYETLFSLKNKRFLKSYDKEMKIFLNTTPYNEQEFIQYFSPRITLNNSTGTNEFVAETNIILTTYGMNFERLNTRSQFLVRYFPETIAIIAEALGKTSKVSLLEED